MFLHVLSEITNNGYMLEWTYILALCSVILAVLTITTKSPIYSVLYLIGLFVAISLYLIISDLAFIGISYLLVYVGAVSILFLFILMLINVRISELLTEGNNSTVLAILVVLVFGLVFHDKLPNSVDLAKYLSDYKYFFNLLHIGSVPHNIDTSSLYTETSNVIMVSSNHWDSSLIQVSHITGIGNILYTALFICIALIGYILLLAMVGAITITVKPKDKSNENENSHPDYMDTWDQK